MELNTYNNLDIYCVDDLTQQEREFAVSHGYVVHGNQMYHPSHYMPCSQKETEKLDPCQYTWVFEHYYKFVSDAARWYNDPDC